METHIFIHNRQAMSGWKQPAIEVSEVHMQHVQPGTQHINIMRVQIFILYIIYIYIYTDI